MMPHRILLRMKLRLLVPIASVTGLGRNVGTYGVGLYKQNDSQYLEFYKLQAGANATIALNDNVITIDAVVGFRSSIIGLQMLIHY